MAAYQQGLDQIDIKHKGLLTRDAFWQYITSSCAATSPLAEGLTRAVHATSLAPPLPPPPPQTPSHSSSSTHCHRRGGGARAPPPLITTVVIIMYFVATMLCRVAAISLCRVAMSRSFGLSSCDSRSWSMSDNPVCSHSRIAIVHNPHVSAQTAHKLSGVSVRISTCLDISVPAQTGHKLSGASIRLYLFIML